MSKLVLSDVQAASFTPQGAGQAVNFNAQLVEWTDTRKPRVAYHEYLKRDGGEAEYMGRSPHVVRMNLVYTGTSWRQNYLAFLAAIDQSPIGTLVHPFIGSMLAICEGVDGSNVNVEQALDTVTVPVSFKESNLNQKLSTTQQQGPAFKQSQAANYVTQLNKITAIYLTASAAVSLFMSTVTQYVASAVAASQSTGTPDPTLPQQQAAVGVTATAARSAIRSDPAATDDVKTFPAIQTIEQLTDLANQLSDSIKTLKPVLSPYIVPAQTTLLALAQQFYGQSAPTRIDEIRTNNPGKILNPAAIPQNTVLLMATPTVIVLQ